MFFFTALILGLTTSLHCIGMCGPIALALPQQLNGKSYYISRVVYNIGRTITYSILGGIFGVLGLGFSLSGYQQQLSIAAGITMLLVLVWQYSIKLQLPSNPIIGFWFKSVNGSFSKLLSRPASIFNLFLIGLVNGLLPCGPVYIALVGAAGAGTIWGGMVYMGIFGIGTIPLMFLISVSGKLFKLRQFNPLIKPTIIAVAFILILRGLNLGIPYISPEFKEDSKGVKKVNCCKRK